MDKKIRGEIGFDDFVVLYHMLMFDANVSLHKFIKNFSRFIQMYNKWYHNFTEFCRLDAVNKLHKDRDDFDITRISKFFNIRAAGFNGK